MMNDINNTVYKPSTADVSTIKAGFAVIALLIVCPLQYVVLNYEVGGDDDIAASQSGVRGPRDPCGGSSWSHQSLFNHNPISYFGCYSKIAHLQVQDAL